MGRSIKLLEVIQFGKELDNSYYKFKSDVFALLAILNFSKACNFFTKMLKLWVVLSNYCNPETFEIET